MNYILFDDQNIRPALLPLTFTRPVCEIRMGIQTISEKWNDVLKTKVSFQTQDYLQIKYPMILSDDNIFINGGICPNAELVEVIENLPVNSILTQGTEVIAYRSKQYNPEVNVFEKTIVYEGKLLILKQLTDIFINNGSEIKADFERITKGRTSQPITDRFTAFYNESQIFIEEVAEKLAPVNSTIESSNRQQSNNLKTGTGLHDSSAALIPYLATFKGQKFVLISTGTWCITLNPFNHTPLTDEELLQDCLIYLQYTGDPVKASRLFAGYEHEQIIKQLSEQFQKPLDYYKTVKFNPKYIEIFNDDEYEPAYHQLILNLVSKQITSSKLVLNDSTVTKLFVDGGFGKNEIYMNLLAKAFPEMEVYAASVAQATALGAALAIHEDWNTKKIPQNLIDLKRY